MTNITSFSNIESAIRRAPESLKAHGRELLAIQGLVTEGVVEPSVLQRVLAASERAVFGHPLVETYWEIFEAPIESILGQIQSLKIKRALEDSQHWGSVDG